MDVSKVIMLTKLFIDLLGEADEIKKLLEKLKAGKDVTDAEMAAAKEKRKEAVSRWPKDVA